MSVRLEGVTIRYGARIAVSDATASFGDGAVGLLGRNGAGKSSVLKAILGLLKPSAGRIRILDLPEDAAPTEIRRRVGYMPEQDCHIPGLNGFETVALAGQLTGMPGLDASQRAHEVLYLVGIEEQRYRPVADYSTGMRQKIKLATALVHDPDLLFLDEPTNGLDPKGRKEMLKIIKGLATDLGKSVVFSSHILSDVETACQNVVLMENGRVVTSGPLSELTRSVLRTLELEAFGDAPAIEAALRAHGADAVERTGELSNVPGGPHHFRLAVKEGTERCSLFAAVLSVNGTVLRLVEHRRTLEEVFLHAVSAEPESVLAKKNGDT